MGRVQVVRFLYISWTYFVLFVIMTISQLPPVVSTRSKLLFNRLTIAIRTVLRLARVGRGQVVNVSHSTATVVCGLDEITLRVYACL